MKYYVYAISSEVRNYIYVGMTNDVARRLIEHNKGYNKTTKPYRPFVLFHVEEYATRALARQREKELKTSSGKRYLRRLLGVE